MTQPTGVFVRLPLSDQHCLLLQKYSDAYEFNKALLAIGTPVTGGDIPVITTLGTLRDPIPCVRQSDHQAAIAALEAEVERLRAENEKLHRIAYSGRGTLTHTIHSPARFADEARKGPEA